MTSSRFSSNKSGGLSSPERVAERGRSATSSIAEVLHVVQEWAEKRPHLTRAFALLCILFLPVIVRNPYHMRILNMILLYSVLSISLNLVVGHTGLLSFGHAAFYGIGAYTTAILLKDFGWSFWIVFPLSGLLAALFGALLGLPSARVRGDYLCVVTIGFGGIAFLVMQNWTSVTRGPMGIPGIPSPTLLSFRLTSHAQYYYFGLALLLLTYWIVKNIHDSKIGRALLAIREDELAASVMGINTFRYKVLSLVLSTFFAGLAGSYLAVYLSFVGPLNFTVDESVLMIIMVIWGGMGSLPGSIFGAASMLGVVELFRPLYQYRLVIWGGVLLFVLLLRPQGVFSRKPYRPRRQVVESEEIP